MGEKFTIEDAIRLMQSVADGHAGLSAKDACLMADLLRYQANLAIAHAAAIDALVEKMKGA